MRARTHTHTHTHTHTQMHTHTHMYVLETQILHRRIPHEPPFDLTFQLLDITKDLRK